MGTVIVEHPQPAVSRKALLPAHRGVTVTQTPASPVRGGSWAAFYAAREAAMLLLDDFGRDGAVAIFRKAIEVETGYNPNFLPSEHLGQWVTGRTGDKHGLRLNTAGRMQAGIVREAARRGISSQELRALAWRATRRSSRAAGTRPT